MRATESLGGECSLMKRRDSETYPLVETAGVTFIVRGEREEDVVRRGDAGHVPVRGIIQ